MSNIPKILKLDLIDVLSKIGYNSSDYQIKGNNIVMRDGGKLTGGWNGQLRGADGNGFLKCNSGKKPGRFEGDNLKMVQEKLGMTQYEAIQWFEEAFPNDLPKGNKKPVKRSLSSEFNELPKVTEEQITYLGSRNIKYDMIKNEVRNYNSSIALAIKSANGSTMSWQGRIIGDEGKKMRYRIKPGSSASGLFADIDNINWEREIFIVEGMTDYLTLRQFTSNVIALVAKGNGIEEMRSLKGRARKGFILIPDNDLGGEEVVSKLEDMNLGIFRLSSYSETLGVDMNDVNDFWKYSLENGLSGEDMLSVFRDDCIKPKKNIDLALMKAVANRDVGSREVGDPVFDEATGGITPGSVMIINGLSGEGKTTTLDWIITSLMVHKKKMGFCSIDDDIGKMLAMFLGRYFHKEWMTEIYPEIENYVKEYGRDKFDNFLLYDDINTLDGFANVIKEEDLDVLIIDYIQVIEQLPGKDMKDKMLNASRTLQRLAIDTRTAIICLCQVSKGEDQKPVLYRTPMESQYIKSTADTFINVGIYNGVHKIAFVKNKYGSTKYKNKEFDTSWDSTTGNISIFKDDQVSSGF